MASFSQSRNEICQCGSGRKFKYCCGRLPDAAPSEAAQPIPYLDAAPPETWFGGQPRSPFEQELVNAVKRGNLPLAELRVRRQLAKFGNSQPDEAARLLNFLGWTAAAAGLRVQSTTFFEEAATLVPDQASAWNGAAPARQSGVQLESLPAGSAAPKFLLIKAWGFGFWADVSHVLCQLLVAELSGRIPIVHWGNNSLFWDGSVPNAFNSYFEPVSSFTIDDLRDDAFRIWPPKWNRSNLLKGEVNKSSGPYSRLAGLYLLGRTEEIVVSDYYTPLLDLRPWIPKHSHLYGLTLEDLYQFIHAKYLRPRKEIVAQVDSFHQNHLAGSDFIAVHIRGSDKRFEFASLDDINRQYQQEIDALMKLHGIDRIFLMTDDLSLLAHFSSRYGNRLVSTDCQRTDTVEGVHHQSGRNRRQLGIEVAVDVYLAIRAKAFVGNGTSNPSLMVRYLKRWPADHIRIIGQDIYCWPGLGPDLHAW